MQIQVSDLIREVTGSDYLEFDANTWSYTLTMLCPVPELRELVESMLEKSQERYIQTGSLMLNNRIERLEQLWACL